MSEQSSNTVKSIRQLLHQASYLISAPSLKQCPDDTGFEVAFAGRSNAGKSSAINALTQQNKLAKTSKTPGRTQLINFFELDENRRIVDLPGYGYAKVPTRIKKEWQLSMETYLKERESLQGLILMMDIRHPLTEFDTQMLEWADHFGMPMLVLLTKADKLKRGAARNTQFSVIKDINTNLPEADVTVELFSALKKEGLPDAMRTIGKWLGVESQPASNEEI